MEKIVDNIWFGDIEVLAHDGRNGNKIVWKRDGNHTSDDLQIILEFEKLGFRYKIYNYEGEFEKNAIKIEFEYNN